MQTHWFTILGMHMIFVPMNFCIQMNIEFKQGDKLFANAVYRNGIIEIIATKYLAYTIIMRRPVLDF